MMGILKVLHGQREREVLNSFLCRVLHSVVENFEVQEIIAAALMNHTPKESPKMQAGFDLHVGCDM